VLTSFTETVNDPPGRMFAWVGVASFSVNVNDTVPSALAAGNTASARHDNITAELRLCILMALRWATPHRQQPVQNNLLRKTSWTKRPTLTDRRSFGSKMLYDILSAIVQVAPQPGHFENGKIYNKFRTISFLFTNSLRYHRDSMLSPGA
jgi:hypothetical protein